jgi:hypothetical protein
MNIDKAKQRSKRLPPVPKKEVKVAERAKPKPIEKIPEVIEVTVEVDDTEKIKLYNAARMSPTKVSVVELLKEPVKPEPIINKKKVAERKRPDPIPKKQLPAIVKDADIKTLKQVIDQMPVDELQLASSPFGASRKNGHGAYSFDDKFLAVSLMRAFCEDREGKLVPNFTRLSALLDVSKITLASWWSQRADIIAGSKGFVSEMKPIITYQLSWMVMNTASIIMERLKTNPDKEKTENLIRIMDKMINKISILNGEPGARKRVDVHHYLPVTAIAPDTA